jgi:hypothetical protein
VLSPLIDYRIAKVQVFLEKIIYSSLLVHPEVYRAHHQDAIGDLHRRKNFG